MLSCLFARRILLNEFTDDENQLLLLQLVITTEKDPLTSVIYVFENKPAVILVDEFCDSLREENVNAEMY
jgi:hypothetical protein